MIFDMLLWDDGYFEIDTHLGLGLGADIDIISGMMEVGQWNLVQNI